MNLKLVLFLLFFGFSFCVGFSQQKIDVNLTSLNTGNSYKLIATNNEYCPVSVQISFKFQNMKASTEQKIFLIPANSKDFALTEISVIDPSKKSSWTYEYFYNYGDALQTTYDLNYSYALPFKKDSSVKIVQGYNGKFSHQNEKSLDFGLKIGEEVYAVREGIVVNAVSNNNKNCATKDCAKYNNYLLVYHSDGTFATYDHFKQNGIIVKKGDIISKNQLIGYSGNTGWSKGPHLHLSVFLQT